MGPAELLHLPASRPLKPGDLPAGWEPRAPRLLLRTDSYPLGATPAPGFASIHPELAHWLGDHEVELVGLDTPSVDSFEDQEMTTHRILERLGLLWIEGLWLDGLPSGLIDLIALPLPLVDADAAPIRVLIRNRPEGETS